MIIVTGASRGLGKAITERLIQKNEEVLGLARNTNEMTIDTIKCDVSDYKSVKNASREVKRLKKPIKAFINAAGVASMNMAVTTDESTVQKLIQTNLVGTIYCCQLFAPIMLRQKSGSFINFSTIAVNIALKGESVYVASKGAVESFSRTLSKEAADFNCTVNTIAPGPVDTNLTKGLTEQQINNIVGDIDGNLKRAIDMLEQAEGLNSDLVVFSELFLSGYPPEDLVLKKSFVEECRNCLLYTSPSPRDRQKSRMPSSA